MTTALAVTNTTTAPEIVAQPIQGRQAPWIGVGTAGQWDNIDEALRDSGLDFEVALRDAICLTNPSSPIYKRIPNINATIRKDTEDILGSVSNYYGIVQNKDAFSLMQPFCNVGAVIEHAGMTTQGMCFMVAKMSNNTILGDNFDYYICAMNSFNAKFPLALFITPVRVICQNMFKGLMKGNENVIKVKHGFNVHSRLLEANDCITFTTNFMTGLDENIKRLNTISFDPMVGVEILFPTPDKNSLRYETSKIRVEEERDNFIDKYYLASDNQDFMDTSYGFLNAYFDYLSHRPAARETGVDWSERRLTGLMSGVALNTKLLRATHAI